MNGTTLKLPPELKKRIAPLAKSAGKSLHAWMVDALRQHTERSELREQFIDLALESAAAVDRGEPVYSMNEVHQFIRARAAGLTVRRPAPQRAPRRR